jgi:hypothetical protein
VITKYLVITNCTARKRSASEALRLDLGRLGSSLQEAARNWRRALDVHAPRLQAQQMYLGRSMVDARSVASALVCPLHVVSAGLGLIPASDTVAPYDLSASGSRGGLQQALQRFKATPAQWWDLLCDGRGLAALLADHPHATVLLALPANYVAMVAKDLGRCVGDDLRRLRLFTSEAGADLLPPVLQDLAMPYDDRLEALPGHAGTRSDFAQRAMRHFVEQLAAQGLTQAQARDAVEAALTPYQKPRSVERKRADDQAIKGLIRRQWLQTGGRSANLLRYLRDEALISCEQGRFARLWREVRLEKARP